MPPRVLLSSTLASSCTCSHTTAQFSQLFLIRVKRVVRRSFISLFHSFCFALAVASGVGWWCPLQNSLTTCSFVAKCYWFLFGCLVRCFFLLFSVDRSWGRGRWCPFGKPHFSPGWWSLELLGKGHCCLPRMLQMSNPVSFLRVCPDCYYSGHILFRFLRKGSQHLLFILHLLSIHRAITHSL